MYLYPVYHVGLLRPGFTPDSPVFSLMALANVLMALVKVYVPLGGVVNVSAALITLRANSVPYLVNWRP